MLPRGFGIAGAQCNVLGRFSYRRALRMLSVRNAWSGLDSLEKIAVVFAVLALTMAAWALGSLATP